MSLFSSSDMLLSRCSVMRGLLWVCFFLFRSSVVVRYLGHESVRILNPSDLL